MAEPAPAREPATAAPPASAAWAQAQLLPCDLTVELELPGLKVRDLLQLGPGFVIDSHWQASADLPLRVNGELVAWSEFEVVGDRLAVRVTEVA
ncbi:MAG TPA: FliM/FliN family flagellar motor C-terminal domain-containing protein [Terriglobales bacterium]|nr:FliM/FliN family flagellar motor C-terminal domain-containing protein [Terriglobales bacterium]